ncbi:chemotaxis protein [Methylocapsa sp. S129]|uniref:chemotaxis protein n=1 Tax=Methylocapsa sp. S129 TaxID=1641869 RepID=UPI00131EBD03|nr:chemotaxis protein [Methylocapsa sp. S129]
MKARRRIAASLLACAWMATPLARAEDAALTPIQLVSNLQNTQGEIARGNLAAYAAQPKLLRDISEAFSATKPEVWKNSREARAAIIYILSGGQPRVIMHLIESGNIPADDEKLMRGALAYVLGHEAEAQKLLGDADPKTLDPALGGQIAFVQSVLLTAIDAKKAVALLDLARLLMPGGLVEEAALRREVFLVGEPDRFLTLAGQYLGRFPKSPYADSFLRSFTATVIRLRLDEDVDNFPKLEAVTENLGDDDRRGVFLAIARAALVSGKIAMADVAASKALTLALADSGDEARGKLYQAAARTLTDQYEFGLAQLQAIDAKKLLKRDVALLAAARTVARRVREKTPAPAASAPPAAADDPAVATIHLAEAALLKSQHPASEGAP